ncbi:MULTISPECIES: helix-turn-helix domain-containing protein [Sphingomonas]|uniref:helix-turn-helix domain-containing protein n=1 Tax=Sphingomonas TaxID=13687 RepID=UPI00254CB32A|nr:MULTISPECIES: helix-turn-helix transcriptional regulator [Sphingomonas]MDK8186743.1 helix-turn-helix transcriptional regulator [Sphingomonas zeae]MDK8216407.1 helix-turn-helix transcriptional regulator [Sphingomonas sp. UMB7805-LC452B]
MDKSVIERIVATLRANLEAEMAKTQASAWVDDPVHRAAVLRAMRAYRGIDQATAARESGLSERTVAKAEKGHAVSESTWSSMLGAYAARGVCWDGRAITIYE